MDVDTDALSERLASVERRLTDADDGTVGDIGAVEGRLADLEERADEIETRVERLESGLQATRGLLGGVDAADESIERRADLALAKAEEIERRLDAADGRPTDAAPTPGRRDADDRHTTGADPATGADDDRIAEAVSSATAPEGSRPDDASERSAGLVGRLRGALEGS
jgi:hypothetical protein